MKKTIIHIDMDAFFAAVEVREKKQVRSYLMTDYNIRKSTPQDLPDIFNLIKRESSLWEYNEWDYWKDDNWKRYKLAIAEGFAYLVFEGDILCGFLRGRDDFGFGIWIHDLLVDKSHRGKCYGRLLMEQVCENFPNSTVYVIGDIPEYYKGKMGYKVEGRIYVVKKD